MGATGDDFQGEHASLAAALSLPLAFPLHSQLIH